MANFNIFSPTTTFDLMLDKMVTNNKNQEKVHVGVLGPNDENLNKISQLALY